MDKKRLAFEIEKKLKSSKDYNEVMSMARGLSPHFYLVGGRVYRTALEIVHGKDFQSTESDWDFLCTDMSSQDVQFAGWQKIRGPGAAPTGIFKKYKSCSPNAIAVRHNVKDLGTLSCKYVKNVSIQSMNANNPPSVDLISLEDMAKTIGKPPQLVSYFEDVPLTIQAIALDTSGVLHGWGVNDVYSKNVSLNGDKPATITGGDIETYARLKVQGLNLNYVAKQRSTGNECLCDGKTLLFSGCKCGWAERKNNPCNLYASTVVTNQPNKNKDFFSVKPSDIKITPLGNPHKLSTSIFNLPKSITKITP